MPHAREGGEPPTPPQETTIVHLSVIVPCHNEAASLGEQLDALAQQTWAGDWEVLVVDNGSTDGTRTLAMCHPLAKDRLRIVDANDGRGVAYARRMGVEASEAKSVAFVDGDDVVAAGWVHAIGEALQRHPLVTGEIEVERLNDARVADSRGTRRLGAPPTFGSIVFLRGNNGGMWRSVWDDLNGFDEDFHGLEDIELSLRAVASGLTVHFEPSALVHYRYRTGWRELWRQGTFYGGSEPLLRGRCRQLGIEPPSRPLRSWAWLVASIPRLSQPAVRTRWLWTLACRTGSVRAAGRSLIGGR